jgi:hypothetical protein
VLFGMLGVTCFGLLFTPAFYTFIRSRSYRPSAQRYSIATFLPSK